MPHQRNMLLAQVAAADMGIISRDLREVEMKHGHILGDSHQRIETVYFPHGAWSLLHVGHAR